LGLSEAGRLHRSIPIHFGIIVCTKNDDFENFAECIHNVLLQFGEDVSNQLIRVYQEQMGIEKLVRAVD